MPSDDNKIRYSGRIKKRDPIFSIPDNCGMTIARPASKIALDCRAKVKPAIQVGGFTQEQMYETFQNGITKGFYNGLDIACKWLEDNNYSKAAQDVRIFVGSSKEAQDGNVH